MTKLLWGTCLTCLCLLAGCQSIADSQSPHPSAGAEVAAASPPAGGPLPAPAAPADAASGPLKFEQSPAAGELLGTWISQTHKSLQGPVRDRLTLGPDGRLTVERYSQLPLLGRLASLSGTYRVESDRLVSNDILGGLEASYRLDGDRLELIFVNGKKAVFQRE